MLLIESNVASWIQTGLGTVDVEVDVIEVLVGMHAAHVAERVGGLLGAVLAVGTAEARLAATLVAQVAHQRAFRREDGRTRRAGKANCNSET